MKDSRDVSVGYELPTIQREMTLAKSRLYSLPVESIHTHEALAKELGLDGIMAEGLMSYGYLSEMCTSFFGNGWVNGGTLAVKFTGLLRLGDLLTSRGVIKEIIGEGPGQKLVLDIWVENQRGEKVAIGTASGFLPTGDDAKTS